MNKEESRPRGTLNLNGTLISNIATIKDKDYSFMIEIFPPNGKNYYFSTDSLSDAIDWRKVIMQASKKAADPSKEKRKQSDFSDSNHISPNKSPPMFYLGKSQTILQKGPTAFPITQGNYMKKAINQDIPEFEEKDLDYFEVNLLDRQSPGQSRPKNFQPLTVQEANRVFRQSIQQAATPTPFSRLVRKSSMSFSSDENLRYFREASSYINEEQTDWRTVKYKEGLKISTLGESYYSTFIQKILAIKIILLGLVGLCGFYGINYLTETYWEVEFPYVWVSIIFNLILFFRRFNSLLWVNEKYSILKSVCTIEERSAVIVDTILNPKNRRGYDIFSYDIQTVKEENPHCSIVQERLKMPQTFELANLYKPRSVVYKRYWCKDENDAYFIMFQSLNGRERAVYELERGDIWIKELEECIVVIPFNNTNEKMKKSIVFFISSLDFGGQIYPLIKDKLKMKRMEMLIGLREYIQNIDQSKINIENMRVKYQGNGTERNKNIEFFKLAEKTLTRQDHEEDDDDDFNQEFESAYNSSGKYEESKSFCSSPSRKEYGQIKRLNPNLKLHPLNIYTNGQKITLEQRFPRYYRYKSGGVWCNNKEELRCQDGIILDLIKSAGKQLFEGKGVVGISMPVRIFEPRSTIERITDWWSTGPIFLPLAAKATDPIERLKFVIAFSISGLYMGLTQRKPFNPILGETYQGFWPDGSKIFCEHTSHHPPITNFYVEAKDYVFWGYYEYIAKVTDLGSSAVGGQKGPSYVDFEDGTRIQFNLPSVKLSGLLFGKRIIQWFGSMIFEDKKNLLEAELKFSDKKGQFKKRKCPTDYFEGEIRRGGEKISTIKGSWVEYLSFDDKLYWVLETTDMIKAFPEENPLPSDCRYREDLIELANKDLNSSQKEKVRLEILQRADKKLREDAKKERIKMNKAK